MNPQELAHASAAHQAHSPVLLWIPGVVAVAVGSKVTRGEDTRAAALKVFVTRKRPLDEVPEDHRIPPHLATATTPPVPTDVEEMEVPTAPVSPALPAAAAGAAPPEPL